MTPPPRFRDFDKEPDPELAADEWSARAAELKAQARRFLRDHYELDDADPYYMERAPVRLAGTGIRPIDKRAARRTIDFDAFEVGTPSAGIDWDPRGVFAARGFDAAAGVRAMAERVVGVKLNHDYRHSNRFDRLPVRYPEAFKHCEINDTVRISGFERGARRLELQRACYLDQVATNIHCDESIDALGGLTWREADIDPETARLRPFEQAVQANTIGVACVFVDRLNRPILRMRRARQDGRFLSVMKSGLHCPASGVLEWKHLLNAGGGIDAESFAHGVLRGMTEEIFDECKILPAEFPYEIAALEFARELPRAGKPQFFLIARFPGIREEVSRYIHSRRQAESKPNEWYEYGDDIDDELPVGHAELGDDQIAKMTYEGFGSMIALTNALPYLQANAVDFRPGADFHETRAR